MDWLFYLGVTILGMSEDDFWASTPDKLVRLANIHNEVNNPKKESDNNYNDIPNRKGEIITRGETQTFRKI